IDLGKLRTIDQVKVDFFDGDGRVHHGFKVEVSNDKVNWTTVTLAADETRAVQGEQAVNFKSQEVRYIRVSSGNATKTVEGVTSSLGYATIEEVTARQKAVRYEETVSRSENVYSNDSQQSGALLYTIEKALGKNFATKPSDYKIKSITYFNAALEAKEKNILSSGTPGNSWWWLPAGGTALTASQYGTLPMGTYTFSGDGVSPDWLAPESLGRDAQEIYAEQMNYAQQQMNSYNANGILERIESYDYSREQSQLASITFYGADGTRVDRVEYYGAYGRLVRKDKYVYSGDVLHYVEGYQYDYGPIDTSSVAPSVNGSTGNNREGTWVTNTSRVYATSSDARIQYAISPTGVVPAGSYYYLTLSLQNQASSSYGSWSFDSTRAQAFNLKFEISMDGGTTWTDAGSATKVLTGSASKLTFALGSQIPASSGPILVRVQCTNGSSKKHLQINTVALSTAASDLASESLATVTLYDPIATGSSRAVFIWNNPVQNLLPATVSGAGTTVFAGTVTSGDPMVDPATGMPMTTLTYNVGGSAGVTVNNDFFNLTLATQNSGALSPYPSSTFNMMAQVSGDASGSNWSNAGNISVDATGTPLSSSFALSSGGLTTIKRVRFVWTNAGAPCAGEGGCATPPAGIQYANHLLVNSMSLSASALGANSVLEYWPGGGSLTSGGYLVLAGRYTGLTGSPTFAVEYFDGTSWRSGGTHELSVAADGRYQHELNMAGAQKIRIKILGAALGTSFTVDDAVYTPMSGTEALWAALLGGDPMGAFVGGGLSAPTTMSYNYAMNGTLISSDTYLHTYTADPHGQLTQTTYYENGRAVRIDGYGLDGSVASISTYAYDRSGRMIAMTVEDLLTHGRTVMSYAVDEFGDSNQTGLTTSELRLGKYAETSSSVRTYNPNGSYQDHTVYVVDTSLVTNPGYSEKQHYQTTVDTFYDARGRTTLQNAYDQKGKQYSITSNYQYDAAGVLRAYDTSSLGAEVDDVAGKYSFNVPTGNEVFQIAHVYGMVYNAFGDMTRYIENNLYSQILTTYTMTLYNNHRTQSTHFEAINNKGFKGTDAVVHRAGVLDVIGDTLVDVSGNVIRTATTYNQAGATWYVMDLTVSAMWAAYDAFKQALTILPATWVVGFVGLAALALIPAQQALANSHIFSLLGLSRFVTAYIEDLLLWSLPKARLSVLEAGSLWLMTRSVVDYFAGSQYVKLEYNPDTVVLSDVILDPLALLGLKKPKTLSGYSVLNLLGGIKTGNLITLTWAGFQSKVASGVMRRPKAALPTVEVRTLTGRLLTSTTNKVTTLYFYNSKGQLIQTYAKLKGGYTTTTYFYNGNQLISSYSYTYTKQKSGGWLGGSSTSITKTWTFYDDEAAAKWSKAMLLTGQAKGIKVNTYSNTWSKETIQTKSSSSVWGQVIGWIVKIIQVILYCIPILWWAAVLWSALVQAIYTFALTGSFSAALTSFVTSAITGVIMNYLPVGLDWLADTGKYFQTAFQAGGTVNWAGTGWALAKDISLAVAVNGTTSLLVGGTASYLANPQGSYFGTLLKMAPYAYLGAALAIAAEGLMSGSPSSSGDNTGTSTWDEMTSWANNFFGSLNSKLYNGGWDKFFSDVLKQVVVPIIVEQTILDWTDVEKTDPLYYMVANLASSLLEAGIKGGLMGGVDRLDKRNSDGISADTGKTEAIHYLNAFKTLRIDSMWAFSVYMLTANEGDNKGDFKGYFAQHFGKNTASFVGGIFTSVVGGVISFAQQKLAEAQQVLDKKAKTASDLLADFQKKNEPVTLYTKENGNIVKADLSFDKTVPKLTVTDTGTGKSQSFIGDAAVKLRLEEMGSLSLFKPSIAVSFDGGNYYVPFDAQDKDAAKGLLNQRGLDMKNAALVGQLAGLGVTGVTYDGRAFIFARTLDSRITAAEVKAVAPEQPENSRFAIDGTGYFFETRNENGNRMMEQIVGAAGGRILTDPSSMQSFLNALAMDIPIQQIESYAVSFEREFQDAAQRVPGVVYNFRATVTAEGVNFSFRVYGKDNSYIDVKDAKADNIADARYGAEHTAKLAAKYNLTIGKDINGCVGVYSFVTELKGDMDSGRLRIDRMTITFIGAFTMEVTLTKGDNILVFKVTDFAPGAVLNGKAKDMKTALQATFDLRKIAQTGNSGGKFDLTKKGDIQGFLGAVVAKGLKNFGLTEMIFEFTSPGLFNLRYGFTQGLDGNFTAQYSLELELEPGVRSGIRIAHSGFAANEKNVGQSFKEMEALKAEVDKIKITSSKDFDKLGKFASLTGSMLLGSADCVISEAERVSGGEFTLSFKDGGNGKPLDYTIFKNADGTGIGIRTAVTLVDHDKREAKLSFSVMSSIEGLTPGAVKTASAKLMEALAGVVNGAVEGALATSLVVPDKAGAFMKGFCQALGTLLTGPGISLEGGSFSLQLIRTHGLEAEILHFTFAGDVWTTALQLSYFSKGAQGDREVKKTLRIPMASAQDGFELIQGLRKLEARGIDAKVQTAKLLLGYANKPELKLSDTKLDTLQQEILSACFGIFLAPGAALASLYGVVVRAKALDSAGKIIGGRFDLMTLETFPADTGVSQYKLTSLTGSKGSAELKIGTPAELPEAFRKWAQGTAERVDITASGGLDLKTAGLAFAQGLANKIPGRISIEALTQGLASWINVLGSDGRVAGTFLPGVTVNDRRMDFYIDRANNVVYAGTAAGKVASLYRGQAFGADDSWKKGVPGADTIAEFKVTALGTDAEATKIAVQ
ncbi:MAG: hypothetical protein WCK89_12360, partial [bacterium]